ncbi:MAG TPA: hypothetical protein DCQ31_08760 [Bacteroidales bacterium]|nr:hypothetical protein [Bacteroidales bacterium]
MKTVWYVIKYLLWAALGTVLVFIIYFTTVYFLQEKFLFPAKSGCAAAPQYIKKTEYLVGTENNYQLNAWYIESSAPRATVLYLHGNAGDLNCLIEQFEVFDDLGLNVFAVDYRGYGKSSGTINLKNDILADSEAAFNYAVRFLNIKPEDIIIWGRSIGSAPATFLANKYKVKALVLESGFAELSKVVETKLPFLPVKQLLKYSYNNTELIGKIECPKLFIHGKNDPLILFENSEILFAKANVPKQLLALQGEHNNLLFVAKKEYLEGVNRFLEPILAK